ncbi:hypothetical protein BT96DRAFT_997764 [Gymnopus androsaceus JB14]|uniref:Uncharacterized protein n=1 Tax=Gymnopus androsaceus JB14 TaxID=1447944 RepID=A0A6A4HBZ1_9AGAR|nr:hypothetical protein BT96DRAFT_997764 [Gymnopus androsaceus JB14]
MERPPTEGWIWKTGQLKNMKPDKIEAWEETNDRVQWFRAEADFEHWQECLERKHADCDCALRRFAFEQDAWDTLAKEFAESPGHAAYACKHRDMFKSLHINQTKFDNVADQEKSFSFNQWLTRLPFKDPTICGGDTREPLADEEDQEDTEKTGKKCKNSTAPSASTRSPIKPKMVSLVRPCKARAVCLHTEKPYSRMAPKLKLSQKVPIPIYAILRESTHTTAPEPLAAVPSGTSIVSQALASKSSLEAPATAHIESKAYCNVESEAYHDVALIQKSIGCRVPNLDENSTKIELNTVTPADVPVLWTHNKNPWLHLKKHPQPLPCIGPYAVHPMLLVLDADPLREPEKGLLWESK